MKYPPRQSPPLILVLLVCTLSALLTACNTGTETTTETFQSPVPHDLAVQTLELADENLKVELFASEPLIADPVAMEIDEKGRIFVVEMPGYPLDTEGSGRIVQLVDTDGDGYPDQSSVFAEGFVFPKGIMRWKQGFLVTDAPHLYYLEDTTGDGRADVREIMLTGFARSNPQHNFNKPLYGLDNWIYLANNATINTEAFADKLGDPGGEIRFGAAPGGTASGPAIGSGGAAKGSSDHPNGSAEAASVQGGSQTGPTGTSRGSEELVLPRNADGRNVRFQPDTRELEMLSSSSQFGHDFDTWGRHFMQVNSAHHQHEAIAARYLGRNPHLLVRSTLHNTPLHGDAATVYPITRNPEHQLLTDVGVFTSASAITFYSGRAWGERYHDVSFVVEPQHNLVHADLVSERGSVFEASRLFENREFLASTDAWFRPVNLLIGPDGALYVVDYYRRIIEHPEWMDEETFRTADLHAGSDRGRIYRITRKEAPHADWTGGRMDLTSQSAEELVKALDGGNIWWRRHLQRLLVDRQDPASVEPLERMARGGARGEARLHALWTLEGLDALDTDLILAALDDEEAGVRESAIVLAERRLFTGVSGEGSTKGSGETGLNHNRKLMQALLEMEEDVSERVRYQLLLTLGYSDDPQAADVRDRILLQHLEDPWFQIASLSAVSVNSSHRLEQAMRELSDRETPGRRSYFRQIGSLMAADGGSDETGRLLILTTEDREAWWSTPLLEGLADQLERQGGAGAAIRGHEQALIELFFDAVDQALRRPILRLLTLSGIPDSLRDQTVQKAVAIVNRTEQPSAMQAEGEESGALQTDGSDTETMQAVGGLSGAEQTDSEQPDTMRPDRHSDEMRTDAIRLLSLVQPLAHTELFISMIDPSEPVSVQLAALEALVQIPGSEIGDAIMERWDLMTPLVRDGAVDVMIADIDRIAMLLEAVGEGRVQISTIGWGRRVILMRDLGGDEVALQLRDRARELLSRDPDLRREVFSRHCSSCHRFGEGSDASFGPDAGTFQHWNPAALVSKVLDPNRSVSEGYEMWIVRRQGGGTVSGVMVSESDRSVTLRVPYGGDVIIPRAEIASMTGLNSSPMPEGFEQQIDPAEMADLVAYIRSGGE